MTNEYYTQVIDNTKDLEAIRSEWKNLLIECHCNTISWTHEWVSTWWRIYPGSDHQSSTKMHIILIRKKSRLIGIVPLYIRHLGILGATRELRLLSTGELEHEETCADGLDLICAPRDSHDCAEVAIQAIAKAPWDVLHLDRVPQSSSLVAALSSSRGGWTRPTLVRTNCRHADLSRGFDAYLESLSSTSRSGARRLLRKALEVGATLTFAESSTTDEYFDELVDMHQARWTQVKAVGCFAAARFRSFHRELARLWIPTGNALIAKVTIRGMCVAMIYGFLASNQRFEFYQSGVSRDSVNGISSPGILGHLMLARALCAQGVEAYDFMAGDSEYKRRLGPVQAEVVSVALSRVSVRAAAWRVESAARRAFWRIFRQNGAQAPGQSASAA